MVQPIAFILAAVQGLTLILNRLDYDADAKVRGVSLDLLAEGERAAPLNGLVCLLAARRRQAHGDGVVVIDGGANLGSCAVPWAQFMRGWGKVIAFEPQQWPFYALCGNLAINNCFNAEARQAALASVSGSIGVPHWAPNEPHNFGGLAVGEGDYAVPAVAIDELQLPRLDIIKLDIEGMEPAAIAGARETIKRLKPLIIAEHFICGAEAIIEALPDYGVIGLGGDVLCVHKSEQNPELIGRMKELARRFNYEQTRRREKEAETA